MMTLFTRVMLLSLLIVCGRAGERCEAGEPATASVTFERPVHFLHPDGSSVVAEPGTYAVERRDSTLLLKPAKDGGVLVIRVEHIPIEMSVTEPVVMSIVRSTDEHLLIYAELDQVVGATGSYSGIRSRDTFKVSPSIGLQIVPPKNQLPGGNLLPGVPRVKSVSYASFANQGALVPFANANVTIVMSNFQGPAGTRISYRIVSPGSITGDFVCTMIRNPRIIVGDSFQLDQNGEGRISLPGWFVSSGMCAIGIELTLPIRPEPSRLVAGPIPVQVPLRYTLAGTSNVRSTLGFRISGSLGICDGTSIGPTNYPVGVVESGADFGFHIRSGPLGTECQFTSKPWVLPDGVRLVSTKWEDVQEIPSGQDKGKCCVVNAFGHNCITMPPHVSNNFTRGTAPVVTGQRSESPPYYSVSSSDQQILEDGVILLDNQPPRMVTVVKPMWGKLQCTNTLFNDHGVKLILREMVLEGPPGLTFP